MKITNKTHWRTDHLKAILQRVALEELSPERRKRLRVVIEYAKRRMRGSSGRASLGGSWMRVRVQFRAEEFDKTDFAHVAAHEMAHCRGMRHDDMRGNPSYVRDGRHREIFKWAEEMPVELKPVKEKTRITDDIKLEKVVSMVAKWERRVKRDQNVLKKWKKREKYFQKKIAAKGPEKVS